MTKPVDEVLAKAMRLDAKSRAELVTELLASLDGPPDPDAEAAWEAEIQRRVAALEAGNVALESWDSVKRRIEKDLRRG
jgi:putative addiction module component (TIGR02574 family)